MADNAETTEPEGQEPKGEQEQKPEGTSLEGEALKAELAKTREEAAKYRTRSKEIEGKFSNLEANYTKAAQQRDTYERELRGLKMERAVSAAARTLEADAELTHAYLQSSGALDGIDPGSEKDVAKAVASALEAKPSLRVSKPQRIGDNGTEGRTETNTMNALIRGALRPSA